MAKTLHSQGRGPGYDPGQGTRDSYGYGLPSEHIQLWELDCKESRKPKDWCLQTVVLEKTPESPLDSKEIKPVNLKGDQPWIITGRTGAEAEASVFWSFDAWREQMTHWKSPWGWKRLRAEGEESVRGWDGWTASLMQWTQTWRTLGDGEGWGGLACCSPGGAGSRTRPGDWTATGSQIPYATTKVL